MKSLLIFAIVLLIAHHTYADPSVRVYECKVDGQHVFSDHVCGDNAMQRDVAASNRMDTVDTRILNAHTRQLVSHKKQSTATTPDRQQRCIKLRKAKEALNEKMRAGFSARQDERLHDRLRKIDSDYFELRCNGLH